MAVPILDTVTPAAGPTSGGDLVRLIGQGLAAQVAVRFGAVPGQVLSVRQEAGLWIADVRTPAHPEALVPVTLENLDGARIPVPGEAVTVADAYRFERTAIVAEATVTRLVRTLLRMLKSQVVQNTSMTVALDYDATPEDQLRVVTMATLPSLVLSGPTVRASRFYASNVPHEDVVTGVSGPELQRRRPAYTVDLAFTLTAASDRTAELLNLMATVASFLNRNRWLELQRDPARPELGAVRWEMDPDGDFRTNLRGRDEIRVFTCGLVVRGFDIDEGLPMDLGKAVADAPELDATPIGGAP